MRAAAAEKLPGGDHLRSRGAGGFAPPVVPNIDPSEQSGSPLLFVRLDMFIVVSLGSISRDEPAATGTSECLVCLYAAGYHNRSARPLPSLPTTARAAEPSESPMRRHSAMLTPA